MKKLNNSLIRTAIIVCGLYFLCQIVADITATKIFSFAGLYLPGGTLVYAVTFTLRDLIHKRLGIKAARLTIITAGVFNVLMGLYLLFTIGLTPAPFWPMQDAYRAILGFVPRIVVASIIAEVVSQLVDTELYRIWITKVTKKYQWARVVFSNGISVPVDSLCFAFLAFFGTMPIMSVLSLVWGQTLFKWAVGLVSMPAIYLIKEK